MPSSILGGGRGSGRIHWYYDTLTPSLRAFPILVPEMVEEILDNMAEQVEAYAQANATWQDRTGEAREGLAADSYRNGLSMGIVLYHTVDYGLWLEVRWSGTYAIIQPTLEVMGPRVMAELEGLL